MAKFQSNFIDSILPSLDLIASLPQRNEALCNGSRFKSKRDCCIKGVTSRFRAAAQRDDFVEACVGLSCGTFSYRKRLRRESRK